MSSDKDLVPLLKSKDIKAFDTFVSEYEKKIYSYAYGFSLNRDDALDITQEVFIKVYKNIDKFKENSSLSTWVYRITSNVCIDYARKNKNNKNISITDENIEFINQIPDNASCTDEIIENRELSDELVNSLNKLDADSKQIVVMRDILGLSYSEIAEILKLEDGTVKSRIARSRKKLRDILIHIRNKSASVPSK